MMASDRDDETFVAYAALTFLGILVLPFGLVLGLLWFAVDRWGGSFSSPATLDCGWPSRIGGDP